MPRVRIEGTFRNGTGEVHLRLTGSQILRYDYNGSFSFEHQLEPGDWIVTLIGYTNGEFEFKMIHLETQAVIIDKVIQGPCQIAEHFLITI
jgi:hypothetical protein